MQPGGFFDQFYQQNPGLFSVVFIIILAWTLYWKGMALWKVAKLDKQGWFIALLILNTLGILEILYIFVFSKKHGEEKQIGV